MTSHRSVLPLIFSFSLALPLMTAASAEARQCKESQHVSLGALSSDSKQAADIVDTAVAAGSFKTLVAAVQAAGLVDALKSEGPFTVFAPSDEAFAKLPAGTVESLLKPENKAKLQAVLAYHVIKGNVASSELPKIPAAATLNGQRVDFSSRNGKWLVDDAVIVQADIACTNGVIHVIDAVVLPSSDTLADVASSAGTFNTLLAAAKAAGLVDALKGDAPLTVLAPTDEAFAKLPAGTVESLLKPENREALKSILTYHIVADRAYSTDVLKGKQAATLQGAKVQFSAKDGVVMVNDATVIRADIDASNGVIHVIDTVLMPPTK